MKPEIEAKFLNADHDALRTKLRALGAECTNPERVMKRMNFDYPDRRMNAVNGWMRVRDEGDKVTMAYKQLDDRSLVGTKEIQIDVSDFNDAVMLLKTIGLNQENYQETKRESWTFQGVEIELDEWPWIKPFVELEGQSEQQLQDVAVQLGLDWSTVTHGSVEVAYQAEYDVTEQEVDDWTEIVFGPVPEWLEKKRRR